MRFSFLAAIAGLGAIALAQVDTSSLPDCAKACVGNSIAQSGCGNIDASCICHNSNLISGLACCVSRTCEPDDIDNTIKFANNICKPFNVQLPQTASCTSSSGRSTATSSSGSSRSTSSSSATTTGSSSSSSSSGSATSSSASSTSASAASQTSSSSSGVGAMPTMKAGVGLGAAVVGVLAAL